MSGGPFLFPLQGVVKDYAWGSRTALATIAGRPPSGGPEAELWLGAHPAGPATILREGVVSSLRDAIAADPGAMLGAASIARFGPELPFLLKILAIEQPLSLQVHPDRAHAAAGFERERRLGVEPERRIYSDARHKPELIVALDHLWLLRGLIEPPEVRRRFAAAGIASFAAATDRLVERGTGGMRDFLEAILGASGALRSRACDEAAQAADDARRSRVGRESPLYWVARLVELHPGDPAVLAPLFLHLVQLREGEGIFQKPGALHSYLEGVGVEVMASSDNVVRAGLTVKTVDVREALDVADLDPEAPAAIAPAPLGAGSAVYRSVAGEFELRRATARGGATAVLDDAGAFVVGICTRGRAMLEAASSGERLELASGGAFAARAGAGSLRFEGDADVFAASLPAPGRTA